MKKLIVLLLAFGLSSAMFAAERPAKNVGKQLERIEAALESDELSERKRAFLENRRDYLQLQVDFRTAIKEALEGLEEDASRDERKAAVGAVRETFKEQFRAYKEARRDAARARREAREAEEGGEG